MLHRRSSVLAPAACAIVFASCGGGGGTSSSALTDTIPPQAGTVRDGLSDDIATQTSTTTIAANWSGFSDDSGTIANYMWAIGTTAGGTEVQAWTSAGTATTATNSSLTLVVGTTYFVAVRAYDAANNASTVSSSNGVQVTSSGGGSGGSGGGSGGGSAPTLASSITQWGVTWQFDQAKTVGQFCNGDWWVLGPVNIVSISPPTQNVAGRQINGSMVNPTSAHIPNGYHGYDSLLFHPYEADRYQAALNVAIGVSANSPLVLPTHTSLISCISYMGVSPAANGSMSQLSTAAVLTVMASEPPTDAFRPPYSGTDKSVRHRESELDYTTLANLTPAPGMPSLATIAAGYQRVWLDHMSGWASRFMHPIDNMPDYGRDFTSLFGTGCLMLNCNFTNEQKRDLLVRMAQIGQDYWGNVQNGGFWEGVGGQGSGRKFPIMLAGAVLHDATMVGIGTTHPSGYYGPSNPNNASRFGEDCQTFYVQQTSAGVYNWGHGGYNASYVGLPEWGNNHTTYPSNDNADWYVDSYRRCCTVNAWVGQTLTARIMNLRTAWNHPAYFDYVDRYMAVPLNPPNFEAWHRGWEPWQAAMWDLYRTNF